MMFRVVLLLSIVLFVTAFVPRSTSSRLVQTRILDKIKITDGVEFDTIAREWRLKWSADNNKQSLASIQQTLNLFLPSIQKVEGVKSIQRVVCGGCLDYKVIIALPAEKFGAWEQKKFSPEGEFLASLKAIPGVSAIETQTYTITPVI